MVVNRTVAYARKIARARAEANMEAMVDINRMTSPVDVDKPSLRARERIVQHIYTGKAYIHALSGGGDTYIGDAGIPLRTTTISIPAEPSPYFESMPRVDDVITVTLCDYDPSLVGRVFQVVVLGGGGPIRSTRELVCTSWGDSNNWEQEPAGS